MSPSDDRIKVPVNGHSTDLEVETGSDAKDAVPTATPENARLSASPTQLAVGFGAITGLVVLVLAALRRRRD